MRHLLVTVGLTTVIATSLGAVDALTRYSPAAGVVLAWADDPSLMLSGLPKGVRIVNTWHSGSLVQLHVDSMRDLPKQFTATRAAIRLPEAGIAIAGCG